MFKRSWHLEPHHVLHNNEEYMHANILLGVSAPLVDVDPGAQVIA